MLLWFRVYIKQLFALTFSNLLGFSVSLLMNSVCLNYFFNPRFLLQLIFNFFPLGAVLYLLFISLKSCIHLPPHFYPIVGPLGTLGTV